MSDGKKDIAITFSGPSGPSVTLRNPRETLTRLIADWGYDTAHYMACQLTSDGIILLPVIEPDPRDCGNSEYRVEVRFESVRPHVPLPKPDGLVVSTAKLHSDK